MGARIVCKNFDYINTRGINLVKQLGWLTFTERQRYSTVVLMYKCLINLAPNYLSDNINMLHEVNPYATRATATMDIKIPTYRTDKYKQSFNYNGAKTWNALPNHIKFSSSLQQFKSNLKKSTYS